MSKHTTEGKRVEEKRRFERVNINHEAQVLVFDAKGRKAGVLRQLARGGFMMEPEKDYSEDNKIYNFTIHEPKEDIRVNAVAPGVVDTPLHRNTPKNVMESLSPMGRPSTVNEIADAVMYLINAATVTGHVLYVDGGAHFGRW